MTSPVAGAADLSRPRSVLDLVGNTPLIRLRRFERADGRVQLYAKAEWKNPGGSVKDRAAVAMVLDGERRGLLTPGKIILDATSGNTGIAYAMIGAALGYPVKLCMPENVTPERRQLLTLDGAEIVGTDGAAGGHGTMAGARLFTVVISPQALQHRLSHGIVGMRQRITSLGGNFRIGRVAGGGPPFVCRGVRRQGPRHAEGHRHADGLGEPSLVDSPRRQESRRHGHQLDD